jgi:hypothetical protein
MLDLGIARLAFRDEVRGTEPVELALRLRAPEGQTLVDREPQALPPTRLTIEGAALPLVRAWRLDLEASPWIAEPRLAAEFQAEGIAGGGLASVDPSLPVWIDGTGVADAVATGSLEARVKWKRRSPLDLDLRGGFSGELSVGRLEMRDAPGGEVLAAIDGIDAEIERVDLARGDVRVKTLEIRKPELRAWRGDDGLHVLGLVARPELRPAAPSPAPAARPVVAKQAPEPAAGGEIRIDELRVRGVSIELRDEAGDPPTKIPLEDLDVVVQRFTTRAFREPLTVRFDAWLGAGEAELPRTAPDRGLVAGLASAVGDVVSGGEKAYGTERRKMFQEAVLSGSVKLYPQLTGHAQASLTGLELVGLRGTAKHEGLEIGDGTLDASVRLRFRGKDGVRVDSELVFTDLSLSEPKRGPVETYLSLPVPLDTVLFLLRNAEGEHRIPVGFTLDEEGLTRARLVGAAVGATTSVIAGAVASAPLRVASTFTDLFGITGGKKSGLPSAEIEFAPGSAALSPQAIDALARVLGPVSSNGRLAVQAQHRFGAADLQRAAILANPSAEDSLEIATGLRRRRAELARSRAEVAADARALWGVGDRKRAEAASLRLRELDAASGSVEDGLDRVLELLRPGADRHREKRTRSAALALGRARLEAVRAWLAAQGVAELEDRFEARPPVFEAGSGAGGGTVLLVLRRR